MKKKLSKIVVAIVSLVVLCSTITTNAEETTNSEDVIGEKKYLGTVVNAVDNSYSESKKLETDDVHFGWEMGEFFVTGYTQWTKDENGNFVFLKNVGDNIKLYFNLKQDINKLDGHKDLKVSSDDNGSDKNLGVKKQDFKHGALIIRQTDYENKIHDPIVYTDFLKAKVSKDADTQVELLEEGDYEVSLDYELFDDGFLFINSYPRYKIAFKFSVRNGNCMVYPFDVKTKSELKNTSATENGFYLDLANSRYLDVMIKREVLVSGTTDFTEDTKDTRYNKPAKDKDEFTDEGIYTITVKNKYTKAEDSKTIYVGSDKLLKAYVNTGYSLDELNQKMDQGIEINEDGQLIEKTETTDKSPSDKKETSKNNKISGSTIAIGLCIIASLLCALSIILRKQKRKEASKEQEENSTNAE